jgi:ubiquinone/menaquinone biosynthesis C-methylase UbiE
LKQFPENSIYLNKSLYSGKLFKVWSNKTDLIPLETYFLEKHLSNKQGKVLEAGTGGGRLIFEVEKRGFTNLEAFDYVENMVTFCENKKKLIKSNVSFKVADATNLGQYKDNQFDYLIYLQQILCFISEENLPKALKEAHRIGKENSTYLYSFLNWDSKFYNPLLSILVNFFRWLRNEKTSKYKLPWLNIDGKFNWRFLNKNQPQNMWFKEKHILNILKSHGFSAIEVKNKINTSDKTGHIHIACKKVI